MHDTTKEHIVKWITFVIVVVIAVCGMISMWPKFQQARALKLQDEELMREIEAKKDEIRKLKEWQARFSKDPDFVEMIAREQRRVFPGELVFVFEK